MRYIFMLIWVVVLIFGVTFASLNAHEVYVDIMIAKIHIFLPLLLLTALVVGAFFGILAMYPKLVSSRFNNRKLRKQIRNLEKEIRTSKQNFETIELDKV